MEKIKMVVQKEQKLKRKRIKWHPRHVTIDTPCPMKELEGLIRMIGEQGYWDVAEVSSEKGKIIVTYGE